MKNTLLAIMAACLMIGGIGFLSSPAKATSVSNPDLIIVDIYIKGVRIEGRTCYIQSYVQNNDDRDTCYTDFWVGFRQDSETGRFLGRDFITTNLGPGQGVWTDYVEFVWENGSHWMGSKADYYNDVTEDNEKNNWHWEFYIGF